MSRPDGVYTRLGYESDPSRLSPDGAKKLLQPGGPAKFDYHRRNPSPPKPHFDFGHAAHRFVLGEGETIAPVYADNWATKSAKEQRNKARENGLIPLLAKHVDIAVEMARVVHEDPLAGKLLAEGQAETWLYATEPETTQGLRIRLDWMTQHDGRLAIVEYKTAADASQTAFACKAYDLGYHVAFAFAITCAQLLELDEAPVYLVIAQEKEPPFLVSVNEFDADAYLQGMKDMQCAIAIYRQCMESGAWPGYDPGIHPISLPPWAFTKSTIADLMETAGEETTQP